MQEFNLIIKSDSFLVSAVAMAAFHNRYHPVKDWLDGLPPWDQENRLEHFIYDCTGCRQSPYLQLIGKYFMVGLVARIYKPGCLMQYMPIFEGEQGVGKSTFWQTLAGQWYQDTPFKLGDKDAYMQLQGVWLYEIAELDSFNKAEATHVKAFITQRNDRFREPYGRRVVDWPRQCVFVGTTNHYEYFKDTTGNRRFWPVKVKSVDSVALALMREQLFAEALWRYRYGEQWHPTFDEEVKYFVPQQELRRVVDPWLYPLQDWLDDLDQRLINEFTNIDILRGCFKVELSKIDGFQAMATRVGRLMQELGWKLARPGAGKQRKRFYRRPS
jgi:predicted P-loop ATPase